MTWNQLLNCIAYEIGRNPEVANMPALVWHYDLDSEHEIDGLDAPYPESEIGEGNMLSMNVKG